MTLPIRGGEDVVRVRQLVRERAVDAGPQPGRPDQDRDRRERAGAQHARLRRRRRRAASRRCDGARRGVRLTFEDEGPGIPDVALALKDGYTTGGGLGLGLGGAKRLSNEFEIVSQRRARARASRSRAGS